MSDPGAVNDFWFGAPGSAEFGRPKQAWFSKNPAFDAEIRERFLPLYERAAAGDLGAWEDSAESSLALALVLDQFPRNMFRGTPRSFGTDARALALAKGVVARGFDLQLPPVQRVFVYLPFEHSENLEDQDRAVELFESLRGDPWSAETIDYAHRHRAVIARFGRFPHRNATLGRASTAEEIEFLRQPGSSF